MVSEKDLEFLRIKLDIFGANLKVMINKDTGAMRFNRTQIGNERCFLSRDGIFEKAFEIANLVNHQKALNILLNITTQLKSDINRFKCCNEYLDDGTTQMVRKLSLAACFIQSEDLTLFLKKLASLMPIEDFRELTDADKWDTDYANLLIGTEHNEREILEIINMCVGHNEYARKKVNSILEFELPTIE